MKNLSILIILICIVLSCSSTKEEPTAVSEPFPKKDSAAIIPEAEFGEINLDTVLQDAIAEFSKREIIDSIFIVNAEIYEVKFEHYCLLDSAIRLDKRYLEPYKLDSFVAHNFVSNLLLIKNGDTVVQKIITKELFRAEADSILMKYGTLHYPTFHFADNKFSFGYSFTIPLTDVGVGVVCRADLKGRLKFEHN